jgi:hypothetical protein
MEREIENKTKHDSQKSFHTGENKNYAQTKNK